jgi:hypothetical protein
MLQYQRKEATGSLKHQRGRVMKVKFSNTRNSITNRNSNAFYDVSPRPDPQTAKTFLVRLMVRLAWFKRRKFSQSLERRKIRLDSRSLPSWSERSAAGWVLRGIRQLLSKVNVFVALSFGSSSRLECTVHVQDQLPSSSETGRNDRV